jgi:transposase InsO family protein
MTTRGIQTTLTGYVVNHKKLVRLYREEKLLVRRRGGRKRAIGLRAPMMIPLAPNERWSLDFVSNQLTDGVEQSVDGTGPLQSLAERPDRVGVGDPFG